MPGTRSFFGICLAAALILLIAVSLAGGLTKARIVSTEVAQGFALWRAYNCGGCHTLAGSGGAYASDLTHIYSQRGSAYLREFLLNPPAFDPNVMRIMPRIDLTADQISQVIAFLQWVDPQITDWPLSPLSTKSQ